MAKPEHLDKLLESVEVWNTWRYENFEIVPALWGVDLEEADLRGADLQRADLEEAILSGADLSGADFRVAIYLKGRTAMRSQNAISSKAGSGS